MKKMKALLVVLTLIGDLAWGRPEVIFPKETEVSNTAVISVFQVAELKGLDGIAYSEMARLPLVEKTEQQSTVTLSRDEISKKLRELVKNSLELQKANPSFQIPTEVRIIISQDGISKIEVEKAYKNFLRAKCGSCIFDIQVKSIPQVQAQNFEIVWDEGLNGGGFLLPVRDSKGTTNKWISGNIKIKKVVPVPRRLIRYGERIQTEDVEMIESNITYLKEECPEKSQVVGLIANKTLTAKTPILLSDLKREPAAQKGQVVKALIGDDKFEVSTNVLAEESGHIGDVIKIKNSETQKLMSATVIEKGVVKIQ